MIHQKMRAFQDFTIRSILAVTSCRSGIVQNRPVPALGDGTYSDTDTGTVPDRDWESSQSPIQDSGSRMHNVTSVITLI